MQCIRYRGRLICPEVSVIGQVYGLYSLPMMHQLRWAFQTSRAHKAQCHNNQIMWDTMSLHTYSPHQDSNRNPNSNAALEKCEDNICSRYLHQSLSRGPYVMYVPIFLKLYPTNGYPHHPMRRLPYPSQSSSELMLVLGSSSWY